MTWRVLQNKQNKNKSLCQMKWSTGSHRGDSKNQKSEKKKQTHTPLTFCVDVWFHWANANLSLFWLLKEHDLGVKYREILVHRKYLRLTAIQYRSICSTPSRREHYMMLPYVTAVGLLAATPVETCKCTAWREQTLLLSLSQPVINVLRGRCKYSCSVF